MHWEEKQIKKDKYAFLKLASQVFWIFMDMYSGVQTEMDI